MKKCGCERCGVRVATDVELCSVCVDCGCGKSQVGTKTVQKGDVQMGEMSKGGARAGGSIPSGRASENSGDGAGLPGGGCAGGVSSTIPVPSGQAPTAHDPQGNPGVPPSVAPPGTLGAAGTVPPLGSWVELRTRDGWISVEVCRHSDQVRWPGQFEVRIPGPPKAYGAELKTGLGLFEEGRRWRRPSRGGVGSCPVWRCDGCRYWNSIDPHVCGTCDRPRATAPTPAQVLANLTGVPVTDIGSAVDGLELDPEDYARSLAALAERRWRERRTAVLGAVVSFLQASETDWQRLSDASTVDAQTVAECKGMHDRQLAQLFFAVGDLL